MPVIINEFEVVVDAAPQSDGAQPQAQPAGSGSINPQAVLDLLRHQAERLARLKAE